MMRKQVLRAQLGLFTLTEEQGIAGNRSRERNGMRKI